jgi:MFS family permease
MCDQRDQCDQCDQYDPIPAAGNLPAVPAPPPPPARSLWSNPDFLKLWTGQTVSELGSRITREGIPLTAVLVLNAGAIQMGWLAALGGAAVLLFGLVAGVWVDRLRRRPLLIAADLGRALVLASIPAAAVAGLLGMGQLYLVAALAGVLTVFFDVAYQSYLPALVARGQILEGNSKLALSSSIAEIAGPGLTGMLVQLLTAPIAILFDAVSFVISALLVGAIRKPEPPPAGSHLTEPPPAGPHLSERPPADAIRSPERPPAGATRATGRLAAEALAGLRWIFADPLLRVLGLRSATAYFCHGLYGSLYILYAVAVLKLRPATLGLVIALGGAAAMAGAILAEPIARRFARVATFLATSTVFGLASLLIPLAGLAPAHAVALLAAAQLGDMALMIFGINEVTLRQEVAPAAVLGRVNAGMLLLARGILPAGALAGGYLAAWLGIRATVAIAAGGLLLSTLWLLAPPLRRLR